MNEPKTSKRTVLIWVAVAALTVKIFLPGVWTRAGEELKPVVDGAQRVIKPTFDKEQDDDGEGQTFKVLNPDEAKKNNPENEDYHFWKPVGGKP